jgi:hypothetical protein
MDPILIGYFPRRQTGPPPNYQLPPGVAEIANVGHYTSDGPANWIDQWRHNAMWFFDSEALARKVITDAIQIDIESDPQRDPPWRVKLSREPGCSYDFYAYKVFPCCFVDGRREDYDLSGLNCEPLPADYERLGYDAVSGEGVANLACSPLFCNGRAGDIPVNRFCLIDEPERALALAQVFSGSHGNGCEPGNYFVLEVWRKKAPTRKAAS